jgi:hypothetical protein
MDRICIVRVLALEAVSKENLELFNAFNVVAFAVERRAAM